ncbi:protein of unknown function [Nitrosomonas sp. Nm166]|nr:protein of unknown function [Nitrosomonas sp. Nm166]
MSVIKIKSCQLVKTIASVFIIMGCSEISAQPKEVKTVTIQVGEHSPDGCKLLGKVKGSSKDSRTEEKDTPYISRLMNARNNLRSEAQKLGGNTVHIIYANNSGKYEIPGVDKEIIFVGNVYDCE